jgi:ribonuclease E
VARVASAAAVVVEAPPVAVEAAAVVVEAPPVAVEAAAVAVEAPPVAVEAVAVAVEAPPVAVEAPPVVVEVAAAVLLEAVQRPAGVVSASALSAAVVPESAAGSAEGPLRESLRSAKRALCHARHSPTGRPHSGPPRKRRRP